MIAVPTFTIKISPRGGLRKLEESYIRFGKVFPENFNKLALVEMADDIVREAKKRATRIGGTGHLARSIDKGKMALGTKRSWLNIIATARYAAAQEYGFAPGHWIPIEYFEQHYTHPGIKGVSTKKGLGFKPRGYAFVKRSTPFLAPAIEYTLQNFDRYVDRAFQKSLSDSGLR